MDDLFNFSDEMEPSKIIHFYEPNVGLKGILGGWLKHDVNP